MNDILQFLQHLLVTIPLELFVLIGTIIDEIISPIPAFAVLIPAGVAAHAQAVPWWHLFTLSLISGVARAVSGLFLYWLADKFEDIIFARGRRLFGASHEDIQRYGKMLSGKNRKKSWIALFIMHALPIFPGTLLSFGAGFIRLPLSIFFSSTALGSAVTALAFLYIGYAGIQTSEFIGHLDTTTQTVTGLLIAGALVIGFYYWYRQRRHKKGSSKRPLS